MKTRPSLCALTAVLVATLASMLSPPVSSAAVDPRALSKQSTPRLVAPFAGERAVQSAARFAFELPRTARDARLVLSRVPFDPSGWVEIPGDQDLTVVELAGGAMSLAATGFKTEGEAPVYWAVAARDARTGMLAVSEVRSFSTTPSFANRVGTPATAPASVVGRLPRPAAPAGAGRPAIHLSSGYTLVPGEQLPVVPNELSSAVAPRDERPGAAGAYLVQFAGLSSDAARDRIAALGGAVVAYVPDRAFLVRLGDEARARLAAEDGAWLGVWEPAYKLSPRIDRASSARETFVAQVFPDADVATARAALIALGASVSHSGDNGINRLIRFDLASDAIAGVAARPEIAWIEPAPKNELFNDQCQWVVQTGISNSRRVWDMGIHGEGQIVMTSDSGMRTTHDQFRDPALNILNFGDYPTHRKVIAYQRGGEDPDIVFGDHSGASYHGTHTAGTVFGSDDGIATSTRDGMAKGAKIYFMDISGPALANGVSPANDLNDLFGPTYIGNAGGAARISSNSWGAPVSGAYTLNSMEVDQFMSAHPDYLVVIADGNAGTAGSVASPATAKDCVSVGGTGNGTSAGNIYTGTSRGPCADGRRKPTVCAPATLTSSYGSTNTAYASLTGTSMATPATAGTATLMRQYLMDGWYPTGAAVPANGFTPSAALLKAMLVNCADNAVTGFTTPDNNVGWGRVTADNVLYFAGDARRLLLVDQTDGLVDGQYVEYQVNVSDASQPLEVTLCWTDRPGHPAFAVQLVNDLDLLVTNGVDTYVGSVWSGGASTTGGFRDSLNVEENVRIAVPTAGIYTVRVSGHNVPIGPQSFALCITGGVGQNAGALALDRSEYGMTDSIQLQVIDTNASGPLSVTVTSSTEPAGEIATLTGANGVFEGTLAIAPTSANGSDGVLSVSAGDALTATYTDASPAASLVAQATVANNGPVISNVAATGLSAGTTLITWTTDKPSTSRVWFSQSGPLASFADSSGYGKQHAVVLGGLVPGATYSYDVESTPIVGASTRDDLGGAHRSFTVKTGGAVLLVLGDPGSALNAAWTNALDALGWNYDVLTEPNIEPPLVGDGLSGLRSYLAVLWQAGFDDYPAFSDLQRAAIDSLMEGGGRLAVSGHDIGWGMCDPTSPGYSAARCAWVASGLKASFVEDPTTWNAQIGTAADPISGAYTGAGINYFPVRDGGAGDEVSLVPGDGTGAMNWLNDDVSPGNDGFRWESNGPKFAFTGGVWTGYTSRLVDMFFEWSRLGSASTANDATRTDVLDKTIRWLIGRDLPQVTIASPNGGEVFTGSSVPITYAITPGSGFNISSRALYYSVDGGQSWSLVDANIAGASGTTWDLTGVAHGIPPAQNSTTVLLRLKAFDDGGPSLSGQDETDAVFTINRTGGDVIGPVVAAGTQLSTPSPIIRGNAATLAARLTEAGRGDGTVAAAEWSMGVSPATAGSGTAMTGTFGTLAVDVAAALTTGPIPNGTQKFWVRGQDAAGNWGPASSIDVIVNGTAPVGVEDGPAVSFLATAQPNPSRGPAMIRFGLAKSGDARLELFDTQGRRVRTLARGTLTAGPHVASWDGRDERGAKVPAGVYLARLVTPGGTFQTRLVSLQ